MYSWIPILVSVIALGISIGAFLRGRNIDLQNQVYLKKLDAFGDIIGEFFNLLKVMGDARDEAKRLTFGDKAFMNDLKLNQLGDKVDLEIEQIQKAIGLKSVYFSEELIGEITDYLETLYGQIDTENSRNPLDDLTSFIGSQTQELEELILKMRNELGLKEMNKKLLRRVEKGSFKNLV